MRRVITLTVVATLAALISGSSLAQAASFHGKPPGPRAIVKIAPRSIAAGGTAPVAGANAGLPSHGSPPVALKASAYRALRAAMHKPQPAPVTPSQSQPAHGTVADLIGSAATGHGHAYWNGSRWVAPAGAAAPRSLPRILIPRGPSGRTGSQSAFPSALYPSTQVDSATANCSNPFPNELPVQQFPEPGR